MGGGGEAHLPRTKVIEGEGEGARVLASKPAWDAIRRRSTWRAARATAVILFDSATSFSMDLGGACLGLGKQKREVCQTNHLEALVPPKRAQGEPRPCPPRFWLLHQMQGYYPRGSQY